MKQFRYVNMHLLLFEQGKVLLSLRNQKSLFDGGWSLISGKSLTHDLARRLLIINARDELGIYLDPMALSVVHAMRRTSDEDCLDVFVSCVNWKGAIKNEKPHRYEDIRFFDVASLPEDTQGYISAAINQVNRGVFASEYKG